MGGYGGGGGMTSAQSQQLTDILADILTAIADLNAIAANTPVTTVTGTVSQNTGTSSAFSAWATIIASTAKKIPSGSASLTGGVIFGAPSSGQVTIEIGTGAVPTAIATLLVEGQAGASLNTTSSVFIKLEQEIPAGTKLSIRSKFTDSNAAGVRLGYNFGQIA